MFERVQMLLKIKNRGEYDLLLCVFFFVCLFLELMATGAHGSCGENALLPVEVASGHACVFVITRPLVTVVDHVREILLNYPGVTLSLAQVDFFSSMCVYKFSPQNIP